MSYTGKPFEELDLMDDFLMNAVAADTEVGEAFCRRLLSVLLQRRIGKLHITAQRTFPAAAPQYRGIRMDVEIKETDGEEQDTVTNVYDLEPHLRNDSHLPRHNRFYQARSDSRYMKRGQDDFSRMPELYIITLLSFDPFGYDYMMYTVQNRCVEVEEINYDDGLKFIYFYTKGTKGGCREIRDMLRYLQDTTADNARNEDTRELHDYVSRVKTMPEVRQGYMTFEDFVGFRCRDAAAEAVKETRIQDICELLEEYGPIPGQLKEKLEAIEDMELLKKYHKLAAKAGSMEVFLEKMNAL